MATKKFNEVFKTSKETVYGDTQFLALIAASLNSTVEFSPVLKSNGSTSTAQYNVQRAKRIKGKDVATPNAKTTTNDNALLDSFSEIEWVTLPVATGVMRSVGIKTAINEEFDPESMGEVHQLAVQSAVGVAARERQENLINEIVIGKGKSNWEALTGTDLFTELSDKADEIMLFADDFKYTTEQEKMIIFMNPVLKTKIEKEMGTAFTQEVPVYQTGLKSRFSIGGIPVVIVPQLNSIEDTDATKRLGAIVMDIEALAFKAEQYSKLIDTDNGLTRYTGRVYYDIQKLVDAERTKVLTFDATGKAAKTKKVSE